MMDSAASLLKLPPDFGDWEAEYRALVDVCALAGRAHRTTVRVTGDRAAEMLDGLVTAAVKDLSGRGRHALLLNAKGRVLSDLRVFPWGDALLLDIPGGGLGNVMASFEKYLPPIYARFENVSDAFAQVGVYGPRAADVAGSALGLDPPEEHLGVCELKLDDDGLLVIRNRRLAGDGIELLGPSETVDALGTKLERAVEAAGGRRAGARALDTASIEWGLPRYGIDIDDGVLAQETGLEEEAISFEKGCFLGQEVVARIHFRGHVNRHLRGLRFAGSGVAPAGARLLDGSKEVGWVTSTALSPDLGSIGLGYVRREIEPGGTLLWSDDDADGELEVLELPFRRRD